MADGRQKAHGNLDFQNCAYLNIFLTLSLSYDNSMDDFCTNCNYFSKVFQ